MGPENPSLSNQKELRFGVNGSKSVDLRKNLWYDRETNEGGGYANLYKSVYGHWPNGRCNDNNNIAAVSDYRDEAGTLLFQVVRKIPKTFRQRRPNGSGGWIWNLDGVRRVLYRLPELIAAQPGTTVFIPEGEKEVDNLRNHLLTATCNPGGAVEHRDKTKSYNGKWPDQYNEFLRGHHVVVLPDNEAAGEAHPLNAAQNLHGSVASVRILRPPKLIDKEDVPDWLANGGTPMRWIGSPARRLNGNPKPNQYPNREHQSGSSSIRPMMPRP
jgi:hypothetical protein